MDIRIDLGSDFKRVTKSLSALADKQIPFAMATALNAIGAAAKEGERKAITSEFPTATPFTINSVAQKKARKNDYETTIFVKDIAAAYLEPYLDGGVHHLNSHALLNPKNINLNQYGNIPRNRLSSLRGQSTVFIGAIKSKKGGTINGVWRRLGKAGKNGQRLQLLIRFGDALSVRQRLPWGETAKRIVQTTFDKEFGKALGKALATARN